MDYLTINDVAERLAGKYVFCRVDTNVTLENGQFKEHLRITKSAETIKKLQELGAKVIVGAHNGREGNLDFVSLGGLAPLLHDKTEHPLRYVGNTWSKDGFNKEAVKVMKAMDSGEALLLENLRFLAGETRKDLSIEEQQASEFVRVLNDEIGIDFYVNDAFSVSHRAQRSIVGFPNIPNIAGINTDKELMGLEKIEERFERRKGEKFNVYILGGKKINDYFMLIRNSVKTGKVDKILMGGFLGNLALFAQGYDLGQQGREDLEREGVWKYLEELKGYMAEYPNIFVAPVDVAYEVGNKKRLDVPVKSIPDVVWQDVSVLDIGLVTIKNFTSIIADETSFVYLKGPLGVFERWNYRKGSRLVLNAVTGNGDIYSVIGGGDTIKMLNTFGIALENFKHYSLAGGALIEAMAGIELPGLKALEQSYEKFH